MSFRVASVCLDPQTSDPTPVDGNIWYNSAEGTFKYHSNGLVHPLVRVAEMPFPEQSSSSATYATLMKWVFLGSDVMGVIQSMKIIARTSASNGRARIYDATNGLEICESALFTNTVDEVIDMGTVSNVPAGEAVFELQVRRSGGGSTTASSINVRY